LGNLKHNVANSVGPVVNEEGENQGIVKFRNRHRTWWIGHQLNGRGRRRRRKRKRRKRRRRRYRKL
jgi:hypothetical protein